MVRSIVVIHHPTPVLVGLWYTILFTQIILLRLAF
jgi:hypothetical protein